MKKLKIWSMLMLITMALPMMVACGGDEKKDTYSDLMIATYIDPNVLQISNILNINPSDYDWLYPNEFFISENNFIPYIAKENNSLIFHIWVLDKNSNKVYSYQEEIAYTLIKSLDSRDSREYKFMGYGFGSLLRESDNGWYIHTIIKYRDFGDNWLIRENLYHFGKNNNTKLLAEEETLSSSSSISSISSIDAWYNNSIVIKSLTKMTVLNHNKEFITTINHSYTDIEEFFKTGGIIELSDYDKVFGWIIDYENGSPKFSIAMVDFSQSSINSNQYFSYLFTNNDESNKSGSWFLFSTISNDSQSLIGTIKQTLNSGKSQTVKFKVDKINKTGQVID